MLERVSIQYIAGAKPMQRQVTPFDFTLVERIKPRRWWQWRGKREWWIDVGSVSLGPYKSWNAAAALLACSGSRPHRTVYADQSMNDYVAAKMRDRLFP